MNERNSVKTGVGNRFTKDYRLVVGLAALAVALAAPALAADAGVIGGLVAAPPSKWCLQELEDEAHQPVFILVNLAFKDFAKKRQFLWRVQVNLTTGEQRKNGQPTNREGEVLNGVEDDILDRLMNATPAYYVGRATVAGSRELIFYVANPDQANSVLGALSKQKWPRVWEYRIVKDQDWARYDDLSGPSPQCR